MTASIPFLLGIAFLLLHEMDAVRHHEWNILPLLDRLGEDVGFLVFTALHLPLYLAVLWWLSTASDDGATRAVAVGVDAFLVVHVSLHVLLRHRPGNRFGKSAFSWVVILGAGLCGLADLVLMVV